MHSTIIRTAFHQHQLQLHGDPLPYTPFTPLPAAHSFTFSSPSYFPSHSPSIELAFQLAFSPFYSTSVTFSCSTSLSFPFLSYSLSMHLSLLLSLSPLASATPFPHLPLRGHPHSGGTANIAAPLSCTLPPSPFRFELARPMPPSRLVSSRLVASRSISISVSIKWRCLMRFSINLDV